MIQAINDIDRLLQAAPSRYGEAYARSLQLSASARGFDVALDATVSPSSIVFIASRVGFTGGTVDFSTNNGTPLSVDGDVATLTPAALMGSGCEVMATVTYQGEPHVARQSVTKLLAFDSSVPPAPAGLAAQGALASINLSWDPTNDTNVGTVEIWRSLTNNLGAAAPVGETAGLARTYPDNIGTAGRFYYWIRYVSKANVLGPFNAQDGTLGTTGTGADHLLELLKDQISESQLLASLRDRINQAVAGSEGAADIAAAIQAETDARIAAIDKEIADRLAALRDEAAAREAYVQNYTYSKVQTDGALATQAQMIAAAFTSYADQAADEAIAIAAADVRNYGYSRAAVDAAEAAQTNAITASYRSYAEGKKDEALTAAAADVRNYSYSKAGTDSAISSLATTLRSEFSNNNGATAAWVQEYAYSKAQTNEAIASQTSTLSSTVGQHTAALQTQGTSINGLSAQYTVKIDNNGYVTGYGLASSYVNGIPTSAFIINADRFAVVAPGLAPKVMFVVGQIAGQPGVGVSGNLIVDDTISARHLKAESIQARHLVISNYGDNLVPDPHMKDPSWWGRPTAEYPNFEGLESPWRSFRIMRFTAANSGNGAFMDTFTPMFPIERGAWYKVDFQVYMSGDFDGYLTAVWHLPAKAWFPMGGPSRGWNWNAQEGGLPVMFEGSSPNKSQVQNFTATVFMEESNPYLTRSQFRICSRIFGGYIELGGFRVTRVADETLIGPGTVQTKHLSISTGGSISSGQTGFDQGDGFWWEGVGNGHGARMSMGRSAGRKIIADPDNNILRLINPYLELAARAVSMSHSPGTGFVHSRFASNGYCGTHTASIADPVSPSYSWSVSSGSTQAQFSIQGTTQQSASVYVTAVGAASGDSVFCTVTCTVSDGGYTRSTSEDIYVEFS